MEPDLHTRLSALEEKVDAVFVSVEKTRKYFLIIMWVSIAMVVLPALGLLFVIPSFIQMYSTGFGIQ